ncbi:MAG: hypothetical protein JO317_03870 [Verrucomicrobiae bacterium]|nr:hypothetical protein [Verrucomicrobiae bacterium]
MTIPAGSTTATVTLNPIGTAGTTDQTATMSLLDDAAYSVGSPNSATVTLVAGGSTQVRPYISVKSYDPVGSESGQIATITIMRSSDGTNFPLVVKYSLSGTAQNGVDYDALPGSVIMPAGANAVVVEIRPKFDSLNEGNESVTLSVLPDANYQMGSPTTSTVTIQDVSSSTPPPSGSLPTVSVTATVVNASEFGTNGVFTVTRTGSTSASLTVNYNMAGTASNGTDYNSLPGSVTIPAGSASAKVTVVPKADSIAEGTETAVMSLSGASTYSIGSPSSAVVQIGNYTSATLPTVTLKANWMNASEDGNQGQFTFTRTGSTSAPLSVHYSVGGSATNGVDYQTCSGWCTIPSGASSATVTIIPIADSIVENNESVVFTLASNSAYQIGSANSATVTIADAGSVTSGTLPTVTVSPMETGISERLMTSGSFLISRTGSTSSALTVHYSMGGVAQNSIDYVALSGTVTIPKGWTSIRVWVKPIQDHQFEPDEDVVLSITGDAAYNVGGSGSATLIIPSNKS